MIERALIAAKLSLVSALWCWLLTALHGILSIGVLRGYLGKGEPFYPSLSVTYGTFFAYGIGAFAICFALSLGFGLIVPRKAQLWALFGAWLMGAYSGANGIAYAFQIDFGTTWGPGEAVRALFYHPIVTPFMTIFGLAGAATLTRRWRNATP